MNVIVAFGGASNENEISCVTGTMAANVLLKRGVRVVPLYISQDGVFYTGEKLFEISAFAALDKPALNKPAIHQTLNKPASDRPLIDPSVEPARCDPSPNARGQTRNAFSSRAPKPRRDLYKKGFKRAIVADGGLYELSKSGKIKRFYKADCLLNCCHGGSGEGGGLSGLCAMAGIPLAGSDEFASSAFLNKYYTKLVLEALGVRTAPFLKITSADDKESLASLGFPLIIKPLTLGSSIGVEKVENPEELAEALNTAFALDGGAIAEKYLFPRREINCAAYRTLRGVQVTECEESLFGGGVFTFEDKYGGGGRSVFPADIPQELSGEIKDITKRVFGALGMRGIARFDFIVCGGEIYLSEVNTVPGSLSQYLVSRSYREFGEVLFDVIEEARASFYGGKKAIITTGILRNIPSNACKMRPK